MIVEKQTEILVLNDGDDSQSSTKMSLDSDSAHVLMQMLSKNIYSDSIGSTIRETTSNGLDSHRRAGVTDAIIVSLKRNQDDNYEFCVEDFGTGLDNNDIENIISKYGKSTKRLEANALGMFGLGFKSPLAYSSSFLFVCRKNGIERKYMMYEGDDGNAIDLLYENSTLERNGVKIILPIKFEDRNDFYLKIQEQLCYFESVYFDVNVDGKIIRDDFVISRGNLFQHSQLNNNSDMHLCLDNVYYPIDWKKLGTNPLSVPIGLRFSLQDGLYPTPNRENLRYTNEAKSIILKRISEVSDYFIDKYNDTITDTEDISSIFRHFNSNNRSLSLEFNHGKILFDIKQFLQHTSKQLVEPKLKGISLLNLRRFANNTSLLFTEYHSKYKLSYNKISENKSLHNLKVNVEDFKDTNYIMTDKFSNIKKAYIRDINPTATYDGPEFIKKISSLKLFPEKGIVALTSYFQILDLHIVPKQDWRTIIKEFKFVQQLFIDLLQNLDTLIIPQTWIDAKRAAGAKIHDPNIPRKPKLQGEVIGKVGVPLLRFVNGKNCKFEPITLKLNEIHKHKMLYVYGSTDNSDILDKLYLTVENKQKVKVLLFSERELKIIEKLNIHNLMSIDKFMEGKNKVFKRIVTANLIDKLINKYEFVFNNRESLIGVSTNLKAKLDTLITYRTTNFEYSDDSIINAMEEVAQEYNLYDGNIYTEYKEIEELLIRLKFLNPVMRTMSPYLRQNISGGEEMKDVLCDLCKYYGYKLDNDNYNILQNKDENVIKEEEKEKEIVTI